MEPRQPELEESSTATVDGVLKSVEAPSDGEGCSICLGQGGQRPRERRRWLETMGSCPMCHRELQEPPGAAKYGIRRSPFILMAMELMDNSDLPDRSNYFRQYR
ncbi:hypothetical protein VPH35_058800 [Triticum aestivum]